MNNTETYIEFRNRAEQSSWPEPPAPEAYYGLAGDVVRAIEPVSEADPVAILIQILTFFGNAIGPGPHFRVESDYHRTNLYAVLVGETGKSRKGTSKGRALEIFEIADPKWLKNCVQSGLSSGEGLIWACRDPTMKRVAHREKGTTIYQDELVDSGVDDKRLQIIETEFARVLKMAARDGNILSEVIRQAWDSGNLRSMTKNSPESATGAHISLVGHITRDELLRRLSATEEANGFANRFWWVCVRRSKYLPEGGCLDEQNVHELHKRIGEAVEFARKVGEMTRDEPTRLAWARLYKSLSYGRPGMFGAMVGRAEAQVVRASLIYALLDKSEVIRSDHLKAALALWDYCEKSARYIFGDALGDPIADTVLQALRNAPGGLTRSDISALFARHKPVSEIARALGVLAGLGLANSSPEETEGRSTQRWTAQ